MHARMSNPATILAFRPTWHPSPAQGHEKGRRAAGDPGAGPPAREPDQWL
jgi:hypothetical protein